MDPVATPGDRNRRRNASIGTEDNRAFTRNL
jgi:hypothetical protein